MDGMKTCRDCGDVKPLNEFHRHRDNRDGRAAYCKPCVRERVRASRAAHPEMYARQKRDTVAASRRSFEKDPEMKRAYERARYAAKTDEYRTRAHAAYLRNSAAYKARAKARKLRLRGVHTPEGDAYAVFVSSDPCVYCGEQGDTTEHIVPLTHGGTHTMDNIASACACCNASKRARSLLQFLLYRQARWTG